MPTAPTPPHSETEVTNLWHAAGLAVNTLQERETGQCTRHNSTMAGGSCRRQTLALSVNSRSNEQPSNPYS